MSAQRAALAFDVDRRDRDVRLAVAGELDLATQESLRTTVAGVLQPPVRALLLDLAGVSFCDAAGVTSLITVRRLAADAGTHFALTGVQLPVRRVLDALGLSSMIPIAYARTLFCPSTSTSRVRVGSTLRRHEHVVVGADGCPERRAVHDVGGHGGPGSPGLVPVGRRKESQSWNPTGVRGRPHDDPEAHSA